MRGFIQETKQRALSGEISKPTADATLSVAQKVFGESYKQASTEISLMSAQLSPLTQNFLNLLSPTGKLPESLTRVTNSLDSAASQIGNLRFNAPSLAAFPGLPSKPNTTAAPLAFGIPSSARGSVVHRDDIAMLHRGNVMMPACLSRRSPGDWMNTARNIRGMETDSITTDVGGFRAYQSPAMDADEPRRAAASSAPTPLHHAITRRSGDTYIEVNVNVAPGSPAANDPQELARLIKQEVSSVRDEIAKVRAKLHDPDFIAECVGRAWEKERSRE